MITFEMKIIGKESEITEYQKRWHEIFDPGNYELSTSFEWTQALFRTSLLKNDLFLIIVLRDSGQIVGIIPLVIRKGRNYGISVTHVFPISELANTHSDILIDGSNHEAIKAFMSALFSLRYQWDVFRIKRFVEANSVLDGLDYYLKTFACKFEITKEEPSFFIKLGSSYNAYLQERSHNFRKDLKKKSKRLEELGSVEVIKPLCFSDLSAVYNNLIYIENKSWKYKQGTSIATIEVQRKFFKTLCESAYERGWLHIRLLFLNNQPIAYNLGLVKDTRYYYLKTSYDEEYKDVSPSTILRAKLIGELISEGIKEIDFTAEPYEWQMQWTDSLRWHKSLLIYNRTIKGRMYYLYNLLNKNVFKRDYSDGRFEYHDRKKIKG